MCVVEQAVDLLGFDLLLDAPLGGDGLAGAVALVVPEVVHVQVLVVPEVALRAVGAGSHFHEIYAMICLFIMFINTFEINLKIILRISY